MSPQERVRVRGGVDKMLSFLVAGDTKGDVQVAARSSKTLTTGVGI